MPQRTKKKTQSQKKNPPPSQWWAPRSQYQWLWHKLPTMMETHDHLIALEKLDKDSPQRSELIMEFASRVLGHDLHWKDEVAEIVGTTYTQFVTVDELGWSRVAMWTHLNCMFPPAELVFHLVWGWSFLHGFVAHLPSQTIKQLAPVLSNGRPKNIAASAVFSLCSLCLFV